MKVVHKATRRPIGHSATSITFTVTLDNGIQVDLWLEIGGMDCDWSLAGTEDPFFWGDDDADFDIQEKIFDACYATPEYKEALK